MLTEQEKFMKEAIRQAQKARALEEVPIGCVIVYEGKIIARGYNRRNTDKNTLSHAELNAIRKASKKLGDWRLEGCTMYVTLEPCQMCAGALVQSRIDEVVIGSRRLQSSGKNHQRRPPGRMLHNAVRLLPRTPRKEKTTQNARKAGSTANAGAENRGTVNLVFCRNRAMIINKE